MRTTLFALLIIIFVSSTLVNISAYYASVSPSELSSINPELQESLKKTKPYDTLLVWIDVQAWVDIFGDRYLPANLALYGINWIMITFDPDIEQTNLFWILAEIKAGRVQEISEISWVKQIMLIKIGEYERLPKNPKLAMEGMDYAIQRAINKGNKTLELLVYIENRTAPTIQRETVLENVTALINRCGGEIVRRGPYKNKVVARIPAQVVEKVTENPYVSEIYYNGPIVFEGRAVPEKQNIKGASNNFVSNVTIKFCYFLILGLIADFTTTNRKNRRRKCAFYMIVILSVTSISALPPTQALDISTRVIQAQPEVWDSGFHGGGINVAVIDTGIDYTHPDFQGAIVYNFTYGGGDPNDTHGHGTHVAGIIAGRGVSNPAYKGVAWEAGLVVIRITTSADLDDAINWVRDNKDQYNIKVLSLSVAAPGFPTGDNGTSVYSMAVDEAVDAGIVVVKSAGNSGPNPMTITTPGDAFNVITVGAIDDNNTEWRDDDLIPNFSSRGPTGDLRPKPDVVAPGVNIASANAFWEGTNLDYVNMTGTSMAAPHVAGSAALLLQAHPNWDPYDVKAALKSSAYDLGEGENTQGAGLIDAYNALRVWVDSRDFSEGVGVDRFAYWHNGSSPVGVWTEFNSSMYSALSRCDDTYAETDTVSCPPTPTQNTTTYQKFKFTNLNLLAGLLGVRFQWEGHAHHGDDRGIDVYAWNHTAQAWDWWPGDYAPFAEDVNVTETTTSNLNDYIQSGNLTFMVSGTEDHPDQHSSYLYTDYVKVAFYLLPDVAVTNVTCVLPYGALAAYPGWMVDVNVTVENEGDFTESFNVTAYYDTTVIPVEWVCVEWVSPTGHNETPGWDHSECAYDDNLGTCAHFCVPHEEWSPNLTLTHAPLTSGKLRFWANSSYAGEITEVDIDIYKDGRWEDAKDGSFTYGEWVETKYTPGNVSAVMIRGYMGEDPWGNGETNFQIWEFDFGYGSLTSQIVTLGPGESTDLTFPWIVPSIPKNVTYPTYTMSANASVVPLEVDIADNNMTGGTVTVRWPGDADGDGHVKEEDQDILDDAYGFSYPHTSYNSSADFNGDGTVNDADSQILNANWHRGPLDNPDIAVTNVTFTPPVVLQGEVVTINVTVKNEGNVTETFPVTAYCSTKAIGTQTVTNLAPDNQTTLTFSWNNTEVPPGNYTISAKATSVQGENDTADNICVGGTVTINGHDVAVVNVSTSFPLGAEAVYPVDLGEWYVNVTVTVQNNGDFNETFTVTTYYDDQQIHDYYGNDNQTVTDLAPGNNVTLTFTWNTANVNACTVVYPQGPTKPGYYIPYTISANASAVPDEFYLANNHMDDGTVTVRRIGDAKEDTHCKGSDFTLLGMAWWRDYPHPEYDPRADFNGDGDVRGEDFTQLAMHWYEYSESPPPPPGTARVYMDPVTVTADLGDTFTVSVKVMNVTDLYSWSVGLQWDPAVLECIGASYIDTFLPDSAEYHNKYLDIEGEVNNTAGRIHPPYSRSLSYPNVAGVNGNGTLMTATFQVKAYGETWINLTEVYLYNSTEAGEIPLEVEGAYVRPGWVSPTGHEEGAGWTNPANVYDGVISTTTVSPSVEGNDWTTYLVLNHSAITSNKIRFWQEYSEYISVLQIDVFRDGDWVNVFEASPPDTDMDWTEVTYDPGLVTKARIRAKGTAQEEECYLEIQEFEFWEILG